MKGIAGFITGIYPTKEISVSRKVPLKRRRRIWTRVGLLPIPLPIFVPVSVVVPRQVEVPTGEIGVLRYYLVISPPFLFLLSPHTLC
ncbi:MAG: hypothetical protein DRH12_11420 [Deltaproteobacteria bacterium]|nr:MAG: hypothetical protein DRH12_11420 [Deltaproteobacteria bacterium]